MNRFISISARLLLMGIAMLAVLGAKANAGSVDERFKVSLNAAIHKVTETRNPVAKREMLADFLTRMNQGLGMAQDAASEKDGQALNVLQLKIQADYAELNGFGTAKIPDAELNHFANYIQQDMEQASYDNGGVYISVGGLIIILLLILIFLR